MSITIDGNAPMLEEFLNRSVGDLLEMGRELFDYADDPHRGKMPQSIRQKIGSLKENSGKLNFGKLGEISGLLDVLFDHVESGTISADEKFMGVCTKANNLSCDILKSIKTSGLEKGINHEEVVADMVKYLEFHVIGEPPMKEHEALDASVVDFTDDAMSRNPSDGESVDAPGGTVLSALVIESGGAKFCVDQKNVMALERMNGERIEHIRNMEFYRVKGEALPVIRLNTFYHFDKKVSKNDEFIIVVEEQGRRFGIVADGIAGDREVVVETLDMEFAKQKVTAGAAIIEDGTLAFVPDLTQLFEEVYRDKKVRLSPRSHTQKIVPDPSAEERGRMLLFQSKGKSLYGVPLPFIDRLETFPREAIEWSGEQAVIRYGRRILPIINLGTPDEGSHEEFTCMIVNVEGIKKGFYVHNLLDVGSYGEESEKSREHSAGVVGTTMVNGKSVTIVNPAIFWKKARGE